jgi:uncharacterized protein with HEPN domain
MPFRDWQLRLQDIVESIDAILQRTADMEFEDFMANRTIVKANLYNSAIAFRITKRQIGKPIMYVHSITTTT